MIKSHVPKHARTGRPRYHDRRTINGIICALISGCRWSEMPAKYEPEKDAS